jgi:biotin carboxyl carrier protein
MPYIRTKFTKIFFILILQGLLTSTPCFSIPDFLDQEGPQGASILRRAIKIPVGFTDNTIHHITLSPGTLLNEISPKISQMREKIGLPPTISLDQQDEFLQGFCWKTAKSIIIKSTMAGTIINVLVHKGQQVRKGKPLCEIEAMKMESIIRALSSGEIGHVFLEKGNKFSDGAALISLSPSSPEWEDIDPTQILKNKDLLISLFPWAASSPIESTYTPSQGNGADNEIQSALVADKNNQPTELLQEELLPSPSLPLGVIISAAQEEPGLDVASPSSFTPSVLSGAPNSILNPPDNLPPDNNVQRTEDTSQSTREEVRILPEPSIDHLQAQEGLSPQTSLRTSQEVMQQAQNTIPVLQQAPAVLPSSTEEVSSIRMEIPFLKKGGEKEQQQFTQMSSSLPKSNKFLKAQLINELKEESDFSLFTWTKWICGLIILSKLIFAIKIMSYYRLRCSQLRKIYYIIFPLPKIRYLHAIDFKKQMLITNIFAHNMNRIYCVNRKAA